MQSTTPLRKSVTIVPTTAVINDVTVDKDLEEEKKLDPLSDVDTDDDGDNSGVTDDDCDSNVADDNTDEEEEEDEEDEEKATSQRGCDRKSESSARSVSVDSSCEIGGKRRGPKRGKKTATPDPVTHCFTSPVSLVNKFDVDYNGHIGPLRLVDKRAVETDDVPFGEGGKRKKRGVEYPKRLTYKPVSIRRDAAVRICVFTDELMLRCILQPLIRTFIGANRGDQDTVGGRGGLAIKHRAPASMLRITPRVLESYLTIACTPDHSAPEMSHVFTQFLQRFFVKFTATPEGKTITATRTSTQLGRLRNIPSSTDPGTGDRQLAVSKSSYKPGGMQPIITQCSTASNVILGDMRLTDFSDLQRGEKRDDIVARARDHIKARNDHEASLAPARAELRNRIRAEKEKYGEATGFGNIVGGGSSSSASAQVRKSTLPSPSVAKVRAIRTAKPPIRRVDLNNNCAVRRLFLNARAKVLSNTPDDIGRVVTVTMADSVVVVLANFINVMHAFIQDIITELLYNNTGLVITSRLVMSALRIAMRAWVIPSRVAFETLRDVEVRGADYDRRVKKHELEVKERADKAKLARLEMRRHIDSKSGDVATTTTTTTATTTVSD